MTFEEFKVHFEKFSSIDSAEKLAICEQQYQQHLQHILDQDFFEPDDKKERSDQYTKYLDATEKLLISPTNSDCKYALIVRPSFEPEFSICLDLSNDHFTITHVFLEKNYWAFSADPLNFSKKIKRSSQTMTLDPVFGNKLILLLENAIRDARPKKSRMITLDGTLFTICRFKNGGAEKVTKHAPSDASKTGKLINLFISLIEIPTITETAIQQREKEVDDLLGL
jgi:hypothetical protein